MTYIKALFEPGEIERCSLGIIDKEVAEPRPFTGRKWLVVRRMIHTTADFELLSLVAFHPEAIRSGIEALKAGCLILTDTEMARMGITLKRMDRLGCEVACYINHPLVQEKASEENKTRAAAAVDYAAFRLKGSIYVIGNAPTALIRLLEIIKENERYKPALIVGMPVGFVNAPESKDLLLSQNRVPFITVRGRKGGSALAASVVNELAEMALEEKGNA